MSFRFSAWYCGLIVVVCMAVSLTLAAKSFGDTGHPPAAVAIENYTFSPQTLTVSVGTEVLWTNKDSDPHTVVSSGDARVLKSAPLDTGETYSFVFTKP